MFYDLGISYISQVIINKLGKKKLVSQMSCIWYIDCHSFDESVIRFLKSQVFDESGIRY